MKRVFGLSVVLVAGSLVSAPQAHAWGDLGHSIVGAVAEQMVEPQTEDFIRGIMGIEPLEVSAVFPDHVRDDMRYGHSDPDPTKRASDIHDFADFHFCEIPTGMTYDTRTNKPAKDCVGAIQGAITLLKDTSGNVQNSEKMIALRYLVHVMGDITQPLHVGNGFDRGANACQILVQDDPAKPGFRTNLHSFWDDTLVTDLGLSYADPTTHAGAAKYLNQYMTAMKLRRAEMFTKSAKLDAGKTELKEWLSDSQSIRESGVYPDAPGSMTGVPSGEEYKNRPYCLWYADQTAGTLGTGSSIQQNKIPVVGDDYKKKFMPIVETQLLKGGLRLAFVLDQIAASVMAQKQSSVPTINDALQEQILSDVQKAFKANVK